MEPSVVSLTSQAQERGGAGGRQPPRNEKASASNTRGGHSSKVQKKQNRKMKKPNLKNSMTFKMLKIKTMNFLGSTFKLKKHEKCKIFKMITFFLPA